MKDTRREEGVRQTGGTGRANAITEGVIWKQLLLFFFPILFGTFFQQLYNTADAVVVGRFVGKEALAAVGGSTSMLTNLLVGFFVGLSSGIPNSKELTGTRTSGGACGLIRSNAKNLT